MISKCTICNNLHSLESQYNTASCQKRALFFSKLAIIELGGWTEESMDSIIKRLIRRYLREKKNIDHMNEVISNTYGFDYSKNFRYMLIQIIGLAKVERLERQIDSAKKTRLEAALKAIKKSRNALAHTHLKGVTATIDAPSVTKAHWNDIYNGLVEIDKISMMI